MKKHYLSDNLMYRVPLEQTMRLILPFFWDAPKTILDVTAGNRHIWGKPGWYNNPGFDGTTRWSVKFNDKFDAKADFHMDFRDMKEIPDFSYDIIVIDVPFTHEIFENQHFYMKQMKGLNLRSFYGRGFIESKYLFEQSRDEFGRIAREGLVVKIADRHQDGKLITQCDDARRIYSEKFQLVDTIYYHGNRPASGMRTPFTNNTISEYIIFKKNRYRR